MDRAEIKPSLFSLKKLRGDFEDYLKQSSAFFGKETALTQACTYALLNGGKRLRPLIVIMLSKALGKGFCAMEAALSVEYFHTASLIADDLPCMDNDDMRREKPSVHKQFGETTALLASYALISAAYEKIFSSVESLKKQLKPSNPEWGNQICTLALKHASKCSGILGATGGQFLDIFSKKIDLEEIYEVIDKKTVTLFKISFLFGWLFGGGDTSEIETITAISKHFGRAFQILDDLLDFSQDNEDSLNIARFLGKNESKKLFFSELDFFQKKMESLGVFSEDFADLTSYLENQAIKS